jgi:transposase
MSQKKKNRVFTKEFIDEAMQLVLKEHRKVSEVAKSLGISPSTLSGWLRKYPAGHGTAGEQSDQAKELRKLKERLRQLEMENAILKKAAAYFAQEVL